MTRKDIIREFYELEIIQFGEFQLKSGMISPFYIDMRKVVSHPPVFKAICIKIWDQIKEVAFDFVCGVPYSGLVFASAAGAMFNLPLVVKRKERKNYGTAKMVEGDFRRGDQVILIEDIVTSGASLVETLEEVEDVGLEVPKIVCIIDRQQGGSTVLRDQGYKMSCLFTMDEIVETMKDLGKLSEDQGAYILDFIAENPAPLLPKEKTKPVQKEEDEDTSRSIGDIAKDPGIIIPINQPRKEEVAKIKISYKDRINDSLHPVTKRLLGIMVEKQTNLIASADVATFGQLLSLADRIGPDICALKTHTDIYPVLSRSNIRALKELAAKHNFLLFEDRKFCDIGSTVQKQFKSAMCSISEWADMITVHVVAGGSTIKALKEIIHEAKTAIVVVAEMSTSDTLTTEEYVQKATEIVKQHGDIVIGAVAQSRILDKPNLLQFTPGINLRVQGDQLGQTYNSPAVAFAERGADLMIVGRGIYEARVPEAAAREYKLAGWKAYEDRLEI